jgi:hypothetical protein
MAWWSDGTSNQLVVGEKFIPAAAVGGDPDVQIHRNWDGGFFGANPDMQEVFNLGRFVHDTGRSIVTNPNDQGVFNTTTGLLNGPNSYTGGSFSFGSAHSGIVNFLIGDGSVHTINGTINTTTLYNLSRVNDGNTVTLP